MLPRLQTLHPVGEVKCPASTGIALEEKKECISIDTVPPGAAVQIARQHAEKQTKYAISYQQGQWQQQQHKCSVVGSGSTGMQERE